MAKLRHENHNKVKIKSLLFLKMRSLAGSDWARARYIADAIEGNADSLYVLLQRWWRWGLVKCTKAKPYGYAIDKEGRRYLGNLSKWYPGDVGALCLEIAVASNAVFWWRRDNPNVYANEPVYYVKAPFESAEDFIKAEAPKGNAWRFTGNPLIVVKCSNGLEAIKAIETYGLHWHKPLVQALVDAKILVWTKDEQQ